LIRNFIFYLLFSPNNNCCRAQIAPAPSKMNEIQKPRVITDYEKLSEAIIEQIKLEYPYGFSQNLISFTNAHGKSIRGLRFETDEKIYLIRMTEEEAVTIVDEDEDFDDDGNLKDDIKDEYEDKYSSYEDDDFDD
jgi:hypothetical protein